MYHSVDIRDQSEVSEVVKQVREHGPITGLIHGAGVIADRLKIGQGQGSVNIKYHNSGFGGHKEIPQILNMKA